MGLFIVSSFWGVAFESGIVLCRSVVRADACRTSSWVVILCGMMSKYFSPQSVHFLLCGV